MALIAVGLLAALIAAGSVAPRTAQAASPPHGDSACPGKRIATAEGCRSRPAAARDVRSILREGRRELGARAVIARVDVGGKRLVRRALGNSVPGVPARARMHFRIGSEAIPYLTTVLLQLRDEGKLSLDDTVDKWFPGLPGAERITLRMLASSTSGYRDYIQGNQAFVDELFENPFRNWRPGELLERALDRGPACDPGACLHYSHANFIVLVDVLRKVTGKPMRRLITRRVLRPLGLRSVRISRGIPIPRPALHAFTVDRGFYEDSTTWSPSWSLGLGSVATGNIDDVTRTARAVGTGKLLSRRSHREMLKPPIPSGIPGIGFGLGVVVAGPWVMQNPFINGYAGTMGHLRGGGITIAVESTHLRRAAEEGDNLSQILMARIGTYLAPDRPPKLP